MRLTKKQKIAVLEKAIEYITLENQPSCLVIGGILLDNYKVERDIKENVTMKYMLRYYNKVNNHLNDNNLYYMDWPQHDRLEFMNNYLKQLKG